MFPSAVKETLLKLVPMQEPALLVGSPGVGKTDTVKEVAEALKQDLMISHPVVDDPTDYKGMPGLVQDKKNGPTAQFLPFGDLLRLINADRPTIAFADDLGQAPPAVQAAYMQLVLARKINGHEISPHVTFLAATNRRQDKAAVTGLITPLLDRFTVVLDYEFSLDDWVRWGLMNNMPPVLLSFARFRPGHLAKFEASRDMKKSSTPRSVAGVGRLINANMHNLDILAGAAGEAFATEFLAFYDTWTKLPDRDKIYADPDSVDVPSEDDSPGVLYALMGSLAFGASPKNIGNMLRYLDRCPKEFAIMALRDASEQHQDLKTTREMSAWAYANRAHFGFVQG
jgi:hypothetical protein